MIEENLFSQMLKTRDKIFKQNKKKKYINKEELLKYEPLYIEIKDFLYNEFLLELPYKDFIYFINNDIKVPLNFNIQNKNTGQTFEMFLLSKNFDFKHNLKASDTSLVDNNGNTIYHYYMKYLNRIPLKKYNKKVLKIKNNFGITPLDYLNNPNYDI